MSEVISQLLLSDWKDDQSLLGNVAETRISVRYQFALLFSIQGIFYNGKCDIFHSYFF